MPGQPIATATALVVPVPEAEALVDPLRRLQTGLAETQRLAPAGDTVLSLRTDR